MLRNHLTEVRSTLQSTVECSGINMYVDVSTEIKENIIRLFDYCPKYIF